MTGLTPLLNTTMTTDPQSAYDELLRRWGVVAPVELEPGVNAWLVMGHQELCQVVRNEQVFSRDPNNWRLFTEGVVPPDSPLGPMMFPRDNCYYADGDKHRRLRAPLVEGLLGLDEHRVSRQVRATCGQLVGGFADRGTADLVGEYAAVLPMLCVAGLFGISIEDGHKLHQAVLAMVSSAAESQGPAMELERILNSVLAAHREHPRDDLTTAFLNHPNLHTDYEVQQSIVVMIAASFQSVMNWTAQTLQLMLADQRFAGRVRGGRLDLDDALDEVLWRDPPTANMPARFALVDCEVGGMPIERGDALILGIAAANSDPRVQSNDPWLQVGNRAHLAWSAGPHACPAQRSSRMIARIAVETVLRQLHDVTLAVPAEQLALMPSPWNRCPASLPVRFTPARTSPRRLAALES
jgi:cytochrome P450